MKTIKITLLLFLCTFVAQAQEAYKHSLSGIKKVKIYTDENEFVGKHKFIGLVDGESCQEKAHHAAPNEIDARTEARGKAYKLGANAIIFSQCVMIEEDKAAKYCLSSTVCYGRAYQIAVSYTHLTLPTTPYV